MKYHDLLPDDTAFQEATSVLQRMAAAVAPVTSALALKEETRMAVPPVGEPPTQHLAGAVNWSEKTYRELLESLPDAMVVVNSDGLMVFVNEQTERTFGYQREELLGRPVELLVPEGHRLKHVEERRRYFGNPKSRAMGINKNLFGRRKAGSQFPVEISLSPLHTEQGILATAIIRDISLRQREEAKFRTLVENIPAVTFIAPLDESVPELYVSPQIEELLGFTQREWVEDPVLWHRQLHPEDREHWNRRFAPTVATGESFDSIYRFIAKDGRVVWVHGSARMVRDAEGKLLFLQGVAFDITAIKEAEVGLREAQEELRVVNVELDRRVKERTAELEHFAKVASHDLTEPLRTLKSFPKKLHAKLAGKIDKEVDDWIDRTIDGTKRLDQLIVQLLHYSRVIRRDRVFKPTDSAACAADACKNLQAAIDESGAEVTRGQLPMVLGNHEELVILFQNLISNAIKFRHPQHKIEVEVGARRVNNQWEFWVCDNGIGLEPRFIETNLFKQGVEGRWYTTSQYPGNGYGLHNCKKIVTGQGGEIWAQSEVGQGSTFFFTLPAVEPAI